jgi:hypothetical protein
MKTSFALFFIILGGAWVMAIDLTEVSIDGNMI